MESFNSTQEQAPGPDISPNQTLESTRILKNKAIEKIKADIAETKKRMEETDLSDDVVLISKLNIAELTEHEERIKKYEDELKQVEAGEISPEFVLYKHSDTDEKLNLVLEKIPAESELANILKSEQELKSLKPEEDDFIKTYTQDINFLRHLSARHKEIEKQQREWGKAGKDILQTEEVFLRAQKINNESDFRKKEEKFFRDISPEHRKELMEISARLSMRNDLKSWVRDGRKFSDTEATPFQVEHKGTHEQVLTYYGEVANLYSEFKKSETENFSPNSRTKEGMQNESDSESQPSENLEDIDEPSNFDGSKTAEEIREYEKENNVNQDILMQSWLTHAGTYKDLMEKVRKAQEGYDLLVKSNDPENQIVVEAKENWNNAVSEQQKEGEVMDPMFQHLSKETLRKYKEDLKYRGVVSEELLNQL